MAIIIKFRQHVQIFLFSKNEKYLTLKKAGRFAFVTNVCPQVGTTLLSVFLIGLPRQQIYRVRMCDNLMVLGT